MKLVRHTKFIHEYENFVSLEECDNIVSLIESADIKESWKVSKNKVRNNGAINLTKCRVEDSLIYQADQKIHNIFSRCNIQYISDNILATLILGHLHITNLKTDYIYRYYDKNDYYDWHIDYDASKHNVFAYILYLNEDFSGGSTLFLNDKLKITPKKGSMLCFPCDFYHIHKSCNIYKGNKKIIWSCFYADHGK